MRAVDSRLPYGCECISLHPVQNVLDVKLCFSSDGLFSTVLRIDITKEELSLCIEWLPDILGYNLVRPAHIVE